jgi:hypothetical protein
MADHMHSKGIAPASTAPDGSGMTPSTGGFDGGSDPASGGDRPPPAGGFGAPAPYIGESPRLPRTHPLANASLAAGIVALSGGCCSIFSLPLAIAAIVLGSLAMTRMKAEPDVYVGSKIALAGIVTGAIGLVFCIILLVVGLGSSLYDFASSPL